VSGCSKDKPATGESSTHDLATISLDDVEKGLAANTLTAIDCNGDDTRKKHGVVPGAVLISDDEAYSPSELPADKARKLVFYCSGPS
jgi:hypothetical protein